MIVSVGADNLGHYYREAAGSEKVRLAAGDMAGAIAEARAAGHLVPDNVLEPSTWGLPDGVFERDVGRGRRMIYGYVADGRRVATCYEPRPGDNESRRCCARSVVRKIASYDGLPWSPILEASRPGRVSPPDPRWVDPPAGGAS